MSKNLLPAVPLSKLDKVKYVNDSLGTDLAIHRLQQINCFVGANNSGKSRLIRAIWKMVEVEKKSYEWIARGELTKLETPLLDKIVEDEAFNNFKEAEKYIGIFRKLLDGRYYVYEEYFELCVTLPSLVDFDQTKLFAFWVEQLKSLPEIIGILKSVKTKIEDIKTKIEYVKNEIRIKKIHLPHYENNLILLELDDVRSLHIQRGAYPKNMAEIRRLESLNLRTEEELNKLLLGKIIYAVGLSVYEELDRSRLYASSFNFWTQIVKARKTDIEQHEKDLKRLEDLLLHEFKSILKSEINNTIKISKSILTDIYAHVKKIYIPILRGMRPFEGAGDCYQHRTAMDYGINYSFTGLSFYNDLKEHLLGSHEKRLLVKEFEEFLSESFFEKLPVSLIPLIESDVVHIRIGEKEHPIHQLGDGVQALIILTFPLFLRKNEEHTIFIEEPEMHLHPKWQRFFIDTVVKHFPKHQFFITTHSNIFLNYKEVSVYRVWQEDIKEGSTLVQYIDTQHGELFEELGYKASDLLNANYIVWVEGVSDKIYLKQFIEAFDATLEEGVHYAIMMYGGCAQLRHFTVENYEEHKIQLSNINPNFAFIVDSDNSTGKGFNMDKEKKSFEKRCKSAKKICWVTKKREIENLIPVDIWKKAALTYTKAVKEHARAVISQDDVELIKDDSTKEIDWDYQDLTKKTVVNITGKKDPFPVNDKIKMAKEVVKLFPKNIEDLKMVAELHDNIQKIVEEIKKANQIDKGDIEIAE